MRDAPILTGIATVAVALVTGCGGEPPRSGADHERVVRVAERDFHISAPSTVDAGKVRLRVANKGPDDHEFVVVRTGSGRLPLRRDGLTVDEDRVEKATVGIIEPAQPGTTHDLQVRLRPGTYALLCNMSGHYHGGMSRRLVVR